MLLELPKGEHNYDENLSAYSRESGQIQNPGSDGLVLASWAQTARRLSSVLPSFWKHLAALYALRNIEW